MHELFHVGTKQEMKITEEEEALDDMSSKAKSPSSLKQSTYNMHLYMSACMLTRDATIYRYIVIS